MDRNEIYYRELLRIRRFEEKVLISFQKGVFQGTTHTYLGQEANAVGALSHIQEGDIVFSNHRCHGHFLAYGGDMRALFAEMMGKESGVCAGRGGSQHLQWKNFFSNGIQGGIVPIATGMAFAEKFLKRDTVAICFLGDGTLGQGVVYEALNMASLWAIPILYIIENNRIAQTTPVEKALAGSIKARFEAFGIQSFELESCDVLEISKETEQRIEEVRNLRVPQTIILHTHRFGPHSKGDDTRDPKVVDDLKREKDPLILHGQRLHPGDLERIGTEVEEEVEKAYEEAVQDPSANELRGDGLAINRQLLHNRTLKGNKKDPAENTKRERTVLQSLNWSIHQVAADDERVVILGEDILDPYGGAFKVTQGLSTTFPDRVLTTPISEAGLIGVAAGLAIRGLRPIVEIMFGDFLTLAADQIINHIAKFYWMYNGQVIVPILIRTPMGGRRGYGPTHSQTLEKIFLGIPGLVTIAPCDMEDPGEVLMTGIRDDNPVLCIENKLLYSLPVQSLNSLVEFEYIKFFSSRGYPYYELKINNAPESTLTIVTYGYMGTLAREAALKLAYEHEIFVKIIVLTQLSPFEMKPVYNAVQNTGMVLTVEEGTRTLGWGTEIITQLADELGPNLKMAKRLAAADLPIPAARPLENAVLPGINDIVRTVKRMVSGI